MEQIFRVQDKVICFKSFPSSLPLASPSSRVHVGLVGATWDGGLQARLPGVQSRSTVAAEWGPSSELPFHPTWPRLPAGKHYGQMVLLTPFQELELDPEPILAYYFKMKSAENTNQILEKSVQQFRVSVLSSYSNFGSQVVTVNKWPLALFIYCHQTSSIARCTAEGRHRQALASRNLQLRFSHSKTREFFYIPLSIPIETTISS